MREHQTIANALHNRGPSVAVRSAEGTGCVTWDRRGRVRALAAPAHARTAHARIIHAHELLHSRYSADAPTTTYAHQIAEDCIIHVAAYRLAELTRGERGTVPHLWRDALAVAVPEARGAFNTIRNSAPGSETHSHARGIALRACYLPYVAMRATSAACRSNDASTERLWRAHTQTYRIGERVLQRDRRPDLLYDFDYYVAQAASLLASWRGKGRARMPKRTRQQLRQARELAYGAATALIEDPAPVGAAYDATSAPPPQLGDGVHYLTPELVAPCSSPLSGMRRVAMPAGARIRTHRLAAVATGAESRPFTTRIRRPDVSAVVLDLSGSMRWCDESLAKLCAALPRTNVYGYCDHKPSTNMGADGTIIRLAADGKRVASIPQLSHGNGCDMQAVELALRHPGRVVFVSDLEFGGQSTARTQRAHELLRANPRVQVIRSRDDALAAFKA